MNFHVLFRNNPASGNDERYFRLKESFRDETGMVRNRTVLTVGFDMNDIPMEDVRLVGDGLTRLYKCRGNRATLFGDMPDDYPGHVRSYTEKYWQEITLRQVKHKEDGDYYLEINSPAKAIKETSMNRQWRERFEQELTKARDALGRKGGKKTYEKVIERVGRAIQKYPSIAKYYVIDYYRDENNPKNMADIKWRIAIPENIDKHSGIYFLRTNVPQLDQKTTWDYYNLICEMSVPTAS